MITETTSAERKKLWDQLTDAKCQIANMYPGSEDAVQELINYIYRRLSGFDHEQAIAILVTCPRSPRQSDAKN